ncbi:ATP SYNTHASE ALPHA CHAIN [Mycoplasmopsis pulmonis]|uniref:ATP synthase subunit alpha 1 n=1 Tax=Mycoplasmopsis pulmonis (strain UAB CTIP) TaxID=272635 RepID=ATPA1_MYCPU|nr:F0F1 ATP synthase subunit alpha [Mycoplasmopsis pulmonis]Q98QU3.1 RecName: Full=ATP synthase subunit alpha 1; AltName: Full=ATP synthase F1 sector subunit alpha 1; AltName: Full=F-ATPase subunit alpha 1 [Mycoplasmopsis pulmonis UAB CTIP]MDZ7293227.1 F0F1 ATP synthase subunit alpha [Mycoplasmopsis pulmonis]CAC13441.1 ATP SYNTHASE ALPHA CHAIN [Mycoplasmopsis pulmonis]VEU68029.1 ATP synthase F0F1 subunit alpha [Mycoplasmopsis pulmonis]
MALKNKDISSIIKERIRNYKIEKINDEVGKVISIGDGIALVSGLKNVKNGELIIFNESVYGLTLNLEIDYIGVAILGNDTLLKEGDEAKRTFEVISIKVGPEILGRVINALGEPIDGKGEIDSEIHRQIFRVAPGVMARESVNEALSTGILAIDSMIPIGKGQRELIIGDRQTGKTAIAIDAIINQKGKNVKCIYVAIGQKNSTVAQIVRKLENHGAMEYTSVVSASASELSPMQYLAPYTGVTIAEEFMETGQDVLIVYDDLSKHAVAYRTLSLLLRRPPGREAYPGDVFYLHSQLLERAAKVNKENGGGSITALPIIETQQGDISAYIATNVISITDGQIFTKESLFNSGQRPAIDVGFSVSRVGSSAQISAMKEVTSSLKLQLAQYNEMLAFSQFGSDLDDSTKAILENGSKIYEILKQDQYSPIDQYTQVILFLAIKQNLINPIPLEYISKFKKAIIHKFNKDAKALNLKTLIRNDKKLSTKLRNEITKIIIEEIKNITKSIANYNPKDHRPIPEEYAKLVESK